MSQQINEHDEIDSRVIAIRKSCERLSSATGVSIAEAHGAMAKVIDKTDWSGSFQVAEKEAGSAIHLKNIFRPLEVTAQELSELLEGMNADQKEKDELKRQGTDPLNLMRFFPKLSLRGIRLSISRQCYSLWLAADVFEKLGDWIEP